MTNRADDFNRAPSITSLGAPSDGGSTWQLFGGGTWGINSNSGYCVASLGVYQEATLQSSNPTGAAQVTINQVGSTGYVGIILRLVDDNNYVMFLYGEGAGQPFYIFEKVAGTFNPALFSGTGTLASGDTLKATVDASNVVRIYQNGTLLGTGTHTSGFTNTLHGMLNNNDTGARYNDYSWTDAGGADDLMAQISM